MIRTLAVPGTAVGVERGTGPRAAQREVDDEVVRVQVLRQVAVLAPRPEAHRLALPRSRQHQH